jgi:hypothetical protein
MGLLESDPSHNLGPDGGAAEYVEIVSREDLTEGSLPESAVALKITHEEGGTFLGVPLDRDNAPLDRSSWRRSNTRAGVVEG